MNILKEKMDLMKWLMDISDKDVIERLKNIKREEVERFYNDNIIYKGPEQIKKALQKGISDHKKGKVYTQDEVIRISEKW